MFGLVKTQVYSIFDKIKTNCVIEKKKCECIKCVIKNEFEKNNFLKNGDELVT